MRFIFIVAIEDLEFASRLAHPVPLKNGLSLTNNPLHTSAYIATDKILTIGYLEGRQLTSTLPVIYKIQEIANVSDVPVEVINFLREVQAFLNAVWFLRDNSANCDLAFAFCLDSDYVHSNSLALHYTTSHGGKCHTSLSSEELNFVCSTHRDFLAGGREQEKTRATSFYSGSRRVNRAGLFLQQARSSDDLGQKIANYCSYFESLLGTSSSELSHQLSERCAFFVEESADSRIACFRGIKRAYGIRSKIVHGDILKQSVVDRLGEVSFFCDDVARRLFNKIVRTPELDKLFDGPSEDLDEFVLKLIFGVQ